MTIPYGRRSGKTTALVSMLRADPDIALVVFAVCERNRIVDEFGLTASEARRVVAVDWLDLLRGRYRRVLVDEVGLIPIEQYRRIRQRFEIVAQSYSS